MKYSTPSPLCKPASARPAELTPAEFVRIAAQIEARRRDRDRRPACYRRDTGFTRVGPLMAGILAEAYASAHGGPDAPARAGGAE